MNPRQFLLIAGVVLVLLGVVGYVLPGGELLGMNWYLTPGENIAHLMLGVVALGSPFVLDIKLQKVLVQVVAAIALFFAVFGFLVANVPPLNTFGLANLENPYDNVLHLVIGLWALYVGFFIKEQQKEQQITPAA